MTGWAAVAPARGDRHGQRVDDALWSERTLARGVDEQVGAVRPLVAAPQTNEREKGRTVVGGGPTR